MKIDIKQVKADIGKGDWRLGVEIPRIPLSFSCLRARLQVGTILEVAPDNETVKRDSLLAIHSKTGEFICRIALDKYSSTEEGFDAEGTGYAEQAEQEHKKPSNQSPTSDPYFQGVPATQFWHAVRMSD